MRSTNRKLALTIFGLTLASGFALSSCETPTLPRIPQEEKDEKDDTSDAPDDGIRVGGGRMLFMVPGEV